MKEFNDLSQENSKLIDKLNFLSLESKRKEENFLWKLYKDFNITFNNLYEFTLFLEKKNPSISLLRIDYQNKSFEEIFTEGFANAPSRLNKRKLLVLRDFLFNSAKSTHFESQAPKNQAGYSRFFASVPERKISKVTEKNITQQNIS